MERHHKDVGAVNGALQVTPEVLHAVRVDMAFDVLHGVVNDLVNVLGIQAFIRLEGIREQFGSGFDVCFDMGLKRLFLATVNNRGSYHPATFQNANHHCLILASSPGNLAAPNILVHVPGFLADERLIDFDLSSGLGERSGLKCKPDSVHHEPRRLLCDADGPMEFHRTDASARTGQQPDCRKPLVQAKRRILKDRASFDAKLLFAFPALPQVAGR